MFRTGHVWLSLTASNQSARSILFALCRKWQRLRIQRLSPNKSPNNNFASTENNAKQNHLWPNRYLWREHIIRFVQTTIYFCLLILRACLAAAISETIFEKKLNINYFQLEVPKELPPSMVGLSLPMMSVSMPKQTTTHCSSLTVIVDINAGWFDHEMWNIAWYTLRYMFVRKTNNICTLTSFFCFSALPAYIRAPGE